MTIASARIGLNDRGLHVIQGKNLTDTSATSNGAGKSSLVDALSWVLFGVTARGEKGDSIVNLAAKKNTSVSMTFSNGSSHYQVTRYRKHKEFKNALHLQLLGATHGDTAVLTKGTDAETQKEVERLIGCSQEVFMASVYAGQEAMPNLPGMTDKQLKTLVEEAAGLERIELAYQEARQRLGASSLECTTIQGSIEHAQRTIAGIVGNIEHQSGLEADWISKRESTIKAYEAQVAEAEARYTAQQSSLEAAEAKLPALEQMAHKLRESIAGVQTFQQAATQAAQAATQAQSALLYIQGAVNNATAQLGNVKQQIEQANAGAFDSKPCPTCGSLPDPTKAAEHRAHVIKNLHDKAQEAERELASQNAKLDSASVELHRAQNAAEAARAAVPDVSVNSAKLSQVNDALARIRSLANEVNGAKNALAMVQGNLGIFKEQANPYTPVLEKLRSDETKQRARLTELEASYAAAQKRYKVLEAVVQVYGPAGVRAHILDTVTPYLNERTADYLSTISDGAITAVWSTLSRTAAGAIREKFSIDVKHAHGGDSFGLISGGEKRKVRLACALALQDLVASRATNQIDLFIGDEIDDALDKAGLERLMTILERKARERGTVLVISHNDLSDWADLVTTVSKVEKHTSTVTGSLVI
ncbi:hypothetical protein ATN89_17170 [Comamonas thiooxydans]|nr:hypothetical protein ATN89_17170 [Comamonas thiooxydans]